MQLNQAKGLSSALLLLDTIVFGWLPYLMVTRLGSSNPNHKLRDIVISHINSFAGGVFLGVCLIGLMVEGRETMEEYLEVSGTHTDLPIYESLIAVGFFLIALVEKSAHICMEGSPLHRKKKPAVERVYLPEVNGNSSGAVVRCKSDAGSSFDAVDSEDDCPKKSKCQSAAYELSDVRPPCVSCATQTEVVVKVETLPDEPQSNNHHLANHHHHHQHQQHHDHLDETVRRVAQTDVLGAFLLLSAFSFHTVFDGLAVGLQDTEDDVWKMFIGIVTHKSLVSLCLGIQFFIVFKDRPIWAFVWVFFLSIVAPIGVGIGVAIFEGGLDEEAQTLASGMLQAVATGTFLYVTCFEILHPELVERPGLLRLFLAIVGFASMLAVNAIPTGGHH